MVGSTKSDGTIDLAGSRQNKARTHNTVGKSGGLVFSRHNVVTISNFAMCQTVDRNCFTTINKLNELGRFIVKIKDL